MGQPLRLSHWLGDKCWRSGVPGAMTSVAALKLTQKQKTDEKQKLKWKECMHCATDCQKPQ